MAALNALADVKDHADQFVTSLYLPSDFLSGKFLFGGTVLDWEAIDVQDQYAIIEFELRCFFDLFLLAFLAWVVIDLFLVTTGKDFFVRDRMHVLILSTYLLVVTFETLQSIIALYLKNLFELSLQSFNFKLFLKLVHQIN